MGEAGDEAFLRRVSLTENGHYATPEICFDKSKEKGHPFAYHVYGTAVITVRLDCLRGTYKIEKVLIVHDFGNSLNPVDRHGSARRRGNAGYRMDDNGRGPV